METSVRINHIKLHKINMNGHLYRINVADPNSPFMASSFCVI